MSCESIRSILDLYAEDRLTAGWTARVKAHVSRCQACAAHERSYRKPAATASPAPASLKERLKRAAAVAQPEWVVPAPRRSELPAAALALALAGVVLAVAHAVAPAVPSERLVSRSVPSVWRLP